MLKEVADISYGDYIRNFKLIIMIVGPFAFFGASCVACANTALLYIYPSLHEMIQNLGPIWQIIVTKLLLHDKNYNMWIY